MTSYEDIRRTNLTARESYSYEGPGIGAGDEALDRLRDYASIEVPDRAVCLEIGFGKGALIQRLIVERDATCIAIDIASASFNDLHK